MAEIPRYTSSEVRQPGGNPSLNERALGVGERFNGWTRNAQLIGAVVTVPFVPILSGALLAGGFYDHVSGDYAKQWQDELARRRVAANTSTTSIEETQVFEENTPPRTRIRDIFVRPKQQPKEANREYAYAA